MKIVMSSGHGKYIRGAAGPKPWGLDEVDEARRVVEQTATVLRGMGVEVVTYHDDVSRTQSENLTRIVDFHNAQQRDRDYSIHFNAYEPTTSTPRGHETLYVSSTGKILADSIVSSVCSAVPFFNRGAKKRTDLKFLNSTEMPAALVEVCFCDAKPDCDLYRTAFNDVCAAIASGIAGEEIEPGPEPEPGLPVTFKGSCSWFGGPEDDGVSPSEGLAFLYEVSDAPDLFLPTQPPGTTGLARRLDPETFYVAARWDYNITSKDMLRDQGLKALVRANGREFLARPADWGPNENTGRAADLSPGLMEALGIETDHQVEVIYPADIEPQPEQATVKMEIVASGPVKIFINGKVFDPAA